MRVRWLQFAVGALGLGFGAATEAIQIGLGVNAERVLIDCVVGETYLLGGLFAWGRQPRNRTWLLMVGVGSGWFVGNLAGSTDPVLHAIGIIFADLDAIFLNALILAYPFGSVEGRANRFVVATAALAVLVPLRWLLAPPQLRRVLGPAVLAISVVLLAIGIAIAIRLIGISA